MAITGSSTQDQIVWYYLQHSGYDHTGSVASCRLFIQACRALLVLHPSDWQHNDSKIAFNPALWKQEQAEAQAWLNANSTAPGSGSVRHLSFGSDFR